MSDLRPSSTARKVILVTSIGFIAHYVFDELVFRLLRRELTDLSIPYWLSHSLSYVIVGIPILLAALILAKPRKVAAILGLTGNPAIGFAASAFFTLPMLIGYAVLYPLSNEITF